ncbi:MAG: PKD domain-containing protein [Bacteroidia bacterium]|nr:PKD domain-containing protein [Bacteroidia bacterium]
MKRILTLLTGCLMAASFHPLKAQLTVSDTLNKLALIQTLFGAGVTISNLTVQCDTSIAVWEFDGTNSNLGLTHGLIMATGEAADAPGPNNSSSVTGSLGRPGYGPLTALANQATFDACVISFDITPLCDSIAIRYVFASEEYNEFVNSINDVFAFYISGPGITAPPPGRNIALVPGTLNTPVSINNVNNGQTNPATGPCMNCLYFQDNTGGTTIQYDGMTVPLTARTEVQACETYRITLAIADAADGILDSGVFLEAGGIGCVTPTLQLEAINSTVLGTNVAVEGCVNNGIFTFTLPLPLDDTTTFYYRIGGTATPGLDYVPFPDSIVIPAGQTTYTLPVSIVADFLVEGAETVELYYVDSTLCANNIYRDTAVMVLWDQPNIPPMPDVAFCSADTVQIGISAFPGADYLWTPSAGLSNDTIPGPLLSLVNAQGPLPDTSQYVLTVTAYQGYCVLLDTLTAVVYPANFADFQVDTVCEGNATSFVSSTVFDQIVQWGWGFGDGSFELQGPAVQHTYAQQGLYQAVLVVQNSKGCLDTVLRPVLVDSLPVVSFTVDPVCLGRTSLIVNDVRPGVSYAWNLGDGTRSDAGSPQHTYGDDGSYTVRMVATTARGCQDSLNVTASVFANPQAAFSATTVCEGERTLFTNQSQAGSSSQLGFQWDFGDGNGASIASPAYLYASYGLRNAVLIVQDGNTCADTASQPVRVYALPSAAFQADSACAGTDFQFVNLSATPDGSRITTSFWDFGNGGTTVALNPRMIYNQPGRYPIFLRVTTEFGCKDSAAGTVGAYPVPSATFDFVSACTFDTIQVVSNSLILNPLFNDQIVDLSWDWGDNSLAANSISRTNGHAYQAPGLYPVTLSAISDKGCIGSLTRTVEAYPIPELPALTGDTVCFGEQGFLVAIDGQHTARLEWFDDLNAAAPFYTGNAFATPPALFTQIYYVQPISDRNCRGSRVPFGVYVYPEGDWNLRFNQEVLEIPQAILEASVQGSKPAEAYAWSLGDGTRSTDPAPVHEYEFPGMYEVSVQVTDADGCPHTLSGVVEVKELIAAFIPSAFTPNGDGMNDEFFIQSLLLQSLSFQVFNRWGQLVYEANTPDFRWNGNDLQGKPLTEGVYVYRFSARDLRGNEFAKEGTVTLVR